MCLPFRAPPLLIGFGCHSHFQTPDPLTGSAWLLQVPHAVYGRGPGTKLDSSGRDLSFCLESYIQEGSNTIILTAMDPRPFVLMVVVASYRDNAGLIRSPTATMRAVQQPSVESPRPPSLPSSQTSVNDSGGDFLHAGHASPATATNDVWDFEESSPLGSDMKIAAYVPVVGLPARGQEHNARSVTSHREGRVRKLVEKFASSAKNVDARKDVGAQRNSGDGRMGCFSRRLHHGRGWQQQLSSGDQLARSSGAGGPGMQDRGTGGRNGFGARRVAELLAHRLPEPNKCQQGIGCALANSNHPTLYFGWLVGAFWPHCENPPWLFWLWLGNGRNHLHLYFPLSTSGFSTCSMPFRSRNWQA